MIRIYTTGTRNRATTILLLVAALGIAAALMFIGLALLAGLAVTGTVIGGGMALWRRIKGGGAALPRHQHRYVSLDPSMEVFDRPTDARRINGPDSRDEA